MTSPTDIRPVPAALAVVAREGRVLLVKRGKAPDLGRWGFPGGRIEPGEGHADAAVRELREETGIEAEASEAIAVLDIIGEAEGTLTHHFVLVAVACRWIAGEPVAADDAADAAWFDLAAVEDDSLPKSRDVLWLTRRALAQAAGD